MRRLQMMNLKFKLMQHRFNRHVAKLYKKMEGDMISSPDHLTEDYVFVYHSVLKANHPNVYSMHIIVIRSPYDIPMDYFINPDGISVCGSSDKYTSLTYTDDNGNVQQMPKGMVHILPDVLDNIEAALLTATAMLIASGKRLLKKIAVDMKYIILNDPELEWADSITWGDNWDQRNYAWIDFDKL